MPVHSERLGSCGHAGRAIVTTFAVLGGGVAGLAAAWQLERARPDAEVLLLEARTRLGGVVETEHTPEGFLLEHGPDALLTRKPVTKQLLDELDLAKEVVHSSQGPRTTYVLRDGRLVALPDGLVAMAPSALWPVLCSPLVSLQGKLRLILEPWVRRGKRGDDESVESFISRRFGRGFLDGVVAPVLEGVYGDGATQLSARTLLPMLVQAEEAHGAVAPALVRARSHGAPGSPAASPFVTPRAGMASVVRAMRSRLRGSVHTSVRVRRLVQTRHGLDVHTFGGGSLRVDGVVLAVPAAEAAKLLEPLDAELSHGLVALPHGDLQLVSFGFAREQVEHTLDGTGFVASRAEGRATRACTWSSQKWPGRAPQGSVLMRCFMQMPEASAADLVEAARRDLRDILGVGAEPSLTRVRMRAASLPRCTVGHSEHVAEIRERCRAIPAVRLAGSALATVGVPDCARSGAEAASELTQAL
jgi:oxygen-dependent protoporphyrinogen oxidase